MRGRWHVCYGSGLSIIYILIFTKTSDIYRKRVVSSKNHYDVTALAMISNF